MDPSTAGGVSRPATASESLHLHEKEDTSTQLADTPGKNLNEPDIEPSAAEYPATKPSSEAQSTSGPLSSRSSTEEYEQTPFDNFKLQVRELCQQLWSPPQSLSRAERRLVKKSKGRLRHILRGKKSTGSSQSSAPSYDFLIERLKGGGFNRIIGITVVPLKGDDLTHLILRVPRYSDAKHESEVAILRFVRQYTSVPVPEIKFVDPTSNNPLKERFIIQSRITGHNLQTEATPSYYPNLSHAQKCEVAKEFANLLLELHFTTHPYPGDITQSSEAGDRQNFKIHPFKCYPLSIDPAEEQDLNRELPFFQVRPFDPKFEPPDDKPPFEQTTYYFMLAQFGRWKALQLRRDPATIGWSKYWDRLVTAAEQMDDVFSLGSDENCLCHLDLAPRNIMATVNIDGSVAISGILDWDSAIFAPRFVGCTPPMWLWAWSDVEEEDEEKHANDEPSTPEQCELKKVFEDTIGDWFLDLAYEPKYRIARSLFGFAHHGMHSSTAYSEADKLLDEWQPIFESHIAKMEEIEKESKEESIKSEASKKREDGNDV